MTSDDELVEALTAIPGVGLWTVNVLLVCNFGRLDVAPAPDAASRRGLGLFSAALRQSNGPMSEPDSLTGPAGLTPYSPDWLNALSEAERKSLPIRNFSRARHDDGGSHVAWLLWSVQEKDRPTPLEFQQGSSFFLDCGRRPFAVTAAHVLEQFVKDRAERRVRGYQIGNIGFDLEERLIDCGADRKIDIATFRITPDEIASIGKKIVTGTDGTWPPPPNVNEVVYFGGFPGCERIEMRPLEHSFGLHSGMVPLTDFTDHQLGCSLDRQYWADVRGLGLPPVGYDLGGVSGGPMLQPIYQDGVWGWRLVGVISEAIMMAEFERFTAVRAHFILPTGYIGR